MSKTKEKLEQLNRETNGTRGQFLILLLCAAFPFIVFWLDSLPVETLGEKYAVLIAGMGVIYWMYKLLEEGKVSSWKLLPVLYIMPTIILWINTAGLIYIGDLIATNLAGALLVFFGWGTRSALNYLKANNNEH